MNYSYYEILILGTSHTMNYSYYEPLTTQSFTVQRSNREGGVRSFFLHTATVKKNTHSDSNAALLKKKIKNPSRKEGIISQTVFEICMRSEAASV